MAASVRATRPEKQLRKWHEMHALSPPPGQTPLLHGPPKELQTQPRERMLPTGGSSGQLQLLLGDGSQRRHGSQACVPCPFVSFLCSWGSTSTPRLWECCEDGRGAGKAAAMLTEVCRGTRKWIRHPESFPCEIRLRVTDQ